MKILYVIGSFFPANNGGPDLSLYLITQALSQKGLSVSVATTLRGISETTQQAYSIKPGKRTRLGKSHVYYFPEYFFLVRFVRLLWWVLIHLKSYDVLHVTSFFAGNTVGAMLLGKMCRKKIILSPRGELATAALAHRGMLKAFFFRFLLFLYRGVDIHVTSEEERKACEIFFPGATVFFLPNLVSFSRNRLLTPFSDKSGVLYLGRLHPHKGIDRLILAYSALPESVRLRHALVLVGTGDVVYEQELKALVERLHLGSFVQFCGRLSGEDKWAVLSRAFVMVLPSKSENFGMVVVEAIEAHTAVITSIYTPWESLQTCGGGLWVDNTSEALLKGLNSVLEMDEILYGDMTQKAFDFAKKRYDLSEGIVEYVSMYQEMMRK